MSMPASARVYREYGCPVPYGDLRVYIEVKEVATQTGEVSQHVTLKRSKAAAQLEDPNQVEQDRQVVNTYFDSMSTTQLMWQSSDKTLDSMVEPLKGNSTYVVERHAGTPISRLLSQGPRRKGYIVAYVPLPSLGAELPPLGFAILSQIRWLGNKDIVMRMVMLASAAFVLIVLLDSGARKRRAQSTFGSVEFTRSFYWAGAVGGIAVVGTAIGIAFARVEYTDGSETFRVVDILRPS